MATRAPIFDRLKLTLFLAQLRTHIPRWQVLSWDSVLTVLNDNHEYGRTIYSDTDPKGDHDSLVSESDSMRLNVSLIVLALDMLSDGVKIDGLSLIKLKAQLMRTLGFQDVSVALPYANGHGVQVAYGEIRSIPVVALPCLGGLLSLLDSWHKTELPASIIVSNSHDSGEEVEVLVGTAYADIPLNMLATYEGIIELPALSIKHILEAVHVIIYKHDFENRDLNVFSGQVFKKATTRALDLFEADAPYEVRQIALSVVQAFFNKSMTTTGSLLLNVIERILKIVNPQVNQLGQDSLTEQGLSFVGDIFEKYSRSGLLISLLRRPLEKKMFLALRRALELHKSSSSLSDELLQDTFARSPETDTALLQDLFHNLQYFVDIVHDDRYSSELLNLTFKQLINFAQRLSDGSGATINASPLVDIAAIVLQHNKSNSNDLASYLDALLRITLIRLQVDTKSISRLLVVVHGKTHSQGPLSTAIATVYEIINEGLRMKTRLSANTLKSVLEALGTAELSPGITPVSLHSQLYVGLVDCGGHWLDNYNWMDGQIEQDFHASLAVAKMIFNATLYDASALQRLSTITERDHRPQLRSIRAWNLLAIAALFEKRDNSWATKLFRELKSFAVVYLGAFWPYAGSTNRVLNFATADINQAYLAIKLWLMVAKRSTELQQPGHIYHSVWNELWPPFESMIGILETEEQSGISPIMTEFIASSVVDLFNFLGCLRIPLRLDKTAQKTTLNRLQSVVRGESVLMKINRAFEWLSEPPPEMPLEVLADQTAKDIIATEKLRLLEGKRDPVKVMMDKRANVEKKTTVDKLNWRT
ncbi:hypothetical protein AGABI1DRAFT_104568 [Agaricus bisporus var. burnettii JB137-S8]|nr:uncharacterized protein AGABI1DRAFT_104568 [Agaricus bisporus var. burnettii JB137-S8]EKM82662.1 hypothetical protein AGABI1DRAFT_104568 [Agaricus bisporus var. burnettii JB137-S8]